MTRRDRAATVSRLEGTQPASSGKRVGAVLLDGLLLAVIQGLAIAVSWGGVLQQLLAGTEPEQVEARWLALPALVSLAVTLFYGIWVWARGVTPGHALLGLRMVGWNDGQVPRGRGLLWFLLGGLIGSVSLGIAPLVVLLRPDGKGRNWLDRTAGTFVVDTRAGADPLRPSAPEQVAEKPEQADPDEDLGATITVQWQGAGAGLPVPSGAAASQAAGDTPLFAPTTSAEPPHLEQSSPSPVSPCPQAEPLITSVPWEAPDASPQAPDQVLRVPPSWTEPEPPARGPVPSAGPTPSPLPGPSAAPLPAPAPSAPAAPSVPAGPSAPAAPSLPSYAGPSVPGVDGPVVPAAPQPVTPAPPAAGEPVGAAPAWEQPEAASGSGQRPEPRLMVDTGQVVELTTERTVLGRAPEAHGEWAHAVAVPVQDPGRSVSKTHLGVVSTAQGLWIQDFGSTNGTTILLPDGTEMAVEGPEASLLPEGACIRMGERLILVER